MFTWTHALLHSPDNAFRLFRGSPKEVFQIVLQCHRLDATFVRRWAETERPRKYIGSYWSTASLLTTKVELQTREEWLLLRIFHCIAQARGDLLRKNLLLGVGPGGP